MTTILFTKRSTWEQHHMDLEHEPKLAKTMTKASLKRLHAAHLQHKAAVDATQEELRRLKVKFWRVNGAEIAFKAKPGDQVVCVGGDGTVLSASHHCGEDVDLMAINSNPGMSFGRLCNAQIQDLKCLTKKSRVTLVPRMRITVDGAVVNKRVLNDVLFSDSCPAAMTRVLDGQTRYACSGLWIGTGAGSTGALKSSGGKVLTVQSKMLQTVVREPFNHSSTRALRMIRPMFRFRSKTVDATLYLDGSFLRVPVGFDQVMEFTLSPEPLRMIGPPLR
jgi:NAD+ kinase